MRDYQLISPSLDGILRHDSIVYEGVRRPEEVLRVMDRRISSGQTVSSDTTIVEEFKVIDQYFNDIYALFMKKLAHFIAEAVVQPDEGVKLQALLQEMIKVKRLSRRSVERSVDIKC